MTDAWLDEMPVLPVQMGDPVVYRGKDGPLKGIIAEIVQPGEPQLILVLMDGGQRAYLDTRDVVLDLSRENGFVKALRWWIEHAPTVGVIGPRYPMGYFEDWVFSTVTDNIRLKVAKGCAKSGLNPSGTLRFDYYKASGEWYGCGELKVELDSAYEHFKEALSLIHTNGLPGLLAGHWLGPIVVTTPSGQSRLFNGGPA